MTLDMLSDLNRLNKNKFFPRTFPANKLRNNYVIFYHFSVTKNVTKKGPFYNVISIRNSNVLKYNVILTSSKNVTTTNK